PHEHDDDRACFWIRCARPKSVFCGNINKLILTQTSASANRPGKLMSYITHEKVSLDCGIKIYSRVITSGLLDYLCHLISANIITTPTTITFSLMVGEVYISCLISHKPEVTMNIHLT
ncbi:hypothetical protein LSH36_184g11029, partial [Paralvinella palmiformis]